MKKDREILVLWRASEVIGSEIQAVDARVGTVADLLFDDHDWKVRWLVIDTGSWLPGRRVLLPPSAITIAEPLRKVLEVGLTEVQVKNCPDLTADEPVSQQREAELVGYYGQMGYGTYGYYPYAAPMTVPAVPIMPPPVTGPGVKEPEERQGDPHLRSAREVTGYDIQAVDGAVGHVEEILVEPDTWSIPHLAVDTKNWWPGRKVIVSVEHVEDISWERRRVDINLTRERVKGSDEYRADEPLAPMAAGVA